MYRGTEYKILKGIRPVYVSLCHSFLKKIFLRTEDGSTNFLQRKDRESNHARVAFWPSVRVGSLDRPNNQYACVQHCIHAFICRRYRAMIQSILCTNSIKGRFLLVGMESHSGNTSTVIFWLIEVCYGCFNRFVSPGLWLSCRLHLIPVQKLN